MLEQSNITNKLTIVNIKESSIGVMDWGALQWLWSHGTWLGMAARVCNFGSVDSQ